MKDESLNHKIEQIFEMIDKLRSNVEKIQSKIVEINQVIHKFRQNKLMNADNLYLNFQITLLENEKQYYKRLMTVILDEMHKDLLHVYDRII